MANISMKMKIRLTMLMIPIYGVFLTFLFFLLTEAYSVAIFNNPPLSDVRLGTAFSVLILSGIASVALTIAIWIE